MSSIGARAPSPTLPATSGSAAPAPQRHVSYEILGAKLDVGKRESAAADTLTKKSVDTPQGGLGHGAGGASVPAGALPKSGTKPSATSGNEGLKPTSDKGKAAAGVGFSLGGGGAHLKTKEEHGLIRKQRKEQQATAAKEKAAKKSSLSLTPGQEKAKAEADKVLAEKEYTKHVHHEEAQKDLADRTLARMPNSGRVEVADGKIYKYAYNSTGKDSAGKAKGFEALGHKITPGGFSPPLPPAIKEQGENLRNQLLHGARNQSVVMRDVTKKMRENHGIYYNLSIPVKGAGDKSGKIVNVDTGWIDKRQQDGTTRGVNELATLIPKGEKT